MRAKWGSQIGFILATAGSAIGLGNIWRFPYLAGKYGGGAFLLVYLLCVTVLGYFLLTAKMAFGRAAQTNIVDGFRVAGDQQGHKTSPLWGYLGGWLAFLNAMLVASVYVIVIGWTASYVVAGCELWLGFSNQKIDAGLFQRLTASFDKQLMWSLLCILATALIIVRGVHQGIEKASLYLMPILFFLLLFMVVWMVFLPGSEKGILFFLKPDWTHLGFTADGFQIRAFGDLLLTALGQAIYSLSMGMGVIFIYGSYLPKSNNIRKDALWVLGLDTMVALLAGLIVLPAVFAFGLEPGQGPALSFVSLPLIFTQMAAGHFLMFLFFLLLFLAALTSLISIYESMVSLMIDKLHLTRFRATGLMAVLNLIFTGIVLLSFTKVCPVTIFGQDLFDAVDKLTGSFTMALMMFVCCLFMGWQIYPIIVRELGLVEHKNPVFCTYLKWTLRVVVPVIMLILFATALF